MFIIKQYVYLPFSIFLLTTITSSTEWESLSHIYETYNEGPGLNHYFNYGPAYDENIKQLREDAARLGKKVTMLEIGVQSGGSTRVWKRYFRQTLAYVGLDINPRCKQFESIQEGIRIMIGSQLNMTLLSNICSTYGPFDLVVDDGGHTNKMITTSLLSLWNCLNDKAIYVIEDLHALNMKGEKFLSRNEVSIFQTLGEWMKIRSPTIGRWADLPASISTEHPAWHLKNLNFVDSVLFLHYADEVPRLRGFKKGSNWVPRIDNNTPYETEKCKGCCVGCYD